VNFYIDVACFFSNACSFSKPETNLFSSFRSKNGTVLYEKTGVLFCENAKGTPVFFPKNLSAYAQVLAGFSFGFG